MKTKVALGSFFDDFKHMFFVDRPITRKQRDVFYRLCFGTSKTGPRRSCYDCPVCGASPMGHYGERTYRFTMPSTHGK